MPCLHCMLCTFTASSGTHCAYHTTGTQREVNARNEGLRRSLKGTTTAVEDLSTALKAASHKLQADTAKNEVCMCACAWACAHWGGGGGGSIKDWSKWVAAQGREAIGLLAGNAVLTFLHPSA